MHTMAQFLPVLTLFSAWSKNQRFCCSSRLALQTEIFPSSPATPYLAWPPWPMTESCFKGKEARDKGGMAGAANRRMLPSGGEKTTPVCVSSCVCHVLVTTDARQSGHAP